MAKKKSQFGGVVSALTKIADAILSFSSDDTYACIMTLSADQTGIASGNTKLNIDLALLDIGGMADVSGKRINIQKTGLYQINTQTNFGSTIATNHMSRVHANGTTTSTFIRGTLYGGGSDSNGNGLVYLEKGDFLELYVGHAHATSLTAPQGVFDIGHGDVSNRNFLHVFLLKEL